MKNHYTQLPDQIYLMQKEFEQVEIYNNGKIETIFIEDGTEIERVNEGNRTIQTTIYRYYGNKIPGDN